MMKIFYFSPISWNCIKQRPHFLVESFARLGHEVCFFSRNAIGRADNHVSSPLPGLIVKERGVLPFALRIPVIDSINSYYLRKSIHWEDFDILLFTEPRHFLLWPFSDGFRGKIIYDCMDRIPEFYSGNVKARMEAYEQALCNRVDAIVVSSRSLERHLISKYSISSGKISLVRNAVNDDIAADRSPAIKRGIVYVGAIDSWFDWSVISMYAQKHPERIITLIGPVHVRPEILPSNIILIGKIPHDQAMRYIRGAELLLVPFKVNSLIEAVDPVKMYEYLAFGKNVLSAYWSELEHFLPNQHLRFYRSFNEFEDGVESILTSISVCDEDTVDNDFIMKNNWIARSREFLNVFPGPPRTL